MFHRTLTKSSTASANGHGFSSSSIDLLRVTVIGVNSDSRGHSDLMDEHNVPFKGTTYLLTNRTGWHRVC